MSKFGLLCAFFGKSDSYRFSTRKIYMQCKEKDVYIFFLAVLTSQWRHKIGYRLFTCIKELICGEVIYTPKIILFCMFVALKWLKTSTETLKWKFDSIWSSILHKNDVDLTSMCWKNTFRTKKNKKKQFWKFACALRLKSDLSITVCSWLSFLKQVSSMMVGAFSCYSMLTTLPYIFIRNKCNQGC